MQETTPFTPEISLLSDTPATAVMQPPAEIKPKRTRKKRAPKHDFKDGRGRIFAHKHDNGGGWVADTARVSDSVYVGARCEIFDWAVVDGTVRLEGRAKIYGHARVRDTVLLKGSSEIFGSARVSDNTKLYDSARIAGGARCGGASELHNSCRIYGNAFVRETHLHNLAAISGDAKVLNSSLNGTGPHGVNITDFATVTHATIYGVGTIAREAQMHHSTVRFYDPQIPFLFTDFAVLINDVNVYMPLQIKDHAVVIGGRFTGYVETGNSAPTIDGNRVVHAGTFTSTNQLLAYLEAANRFVAPPSNTAAEVINPGVILNQNATITPGAPVVIAAAPVVLATGSRRILRAPDPAETT